MNIKFHLVFEKSFIYISCVGLYNLDDMLKLYKSGVLLAFNLKHNKVLFDLKETSGATIYTIDRVIQGDYFKQFSCNSNVSIKAAFVGLESFIDNIQYFEPVNFNGNDKGKVFNNLDDAIKWLSKKQSLLFRKSA